MYSFFRPESTQITHFPRNLHPATIYRKFRICARKTGTHCLAPLSRKQYISCLSSAPIYMEQSPSSSPDLAENWRAVNQAIQAACQRAGRSPSEITVVAVTKTHPADMARKACALGIRHVGENRVQEAIEKYSDSSILVSFPGTRLHLVGHLQRNKVRRALQVFDNIDSLDTEELALTLDAEAEKRRKTVRVLLEANTSKEPQKFGIDPDSAVHLANAVRNCRSLQLAGLMTVGPNTDDRDQIRQSFRLLKHLYDDIGCRLQPEHWSVLSMGMSGDFEIAIEEGATELRLGTVLFGQRRG